MTQILIPLIAMASVLAIGLAYIFLSNAAPLDVSNEPTVSDESLGEYGQLQARLADLDKPYIRRPLLKTRSDAAIAVTVVLVSLVTFYSVEQRYGGPTGLLAMTLVCILVNFGSHHFQKVLERREILRRMLVWRLTHPSTKTGVPDGLNNVSSVPKPR